jgi:hypothetical protein
MACRHVGGLGARWDYLSHDETSATGWIVCRTCGALLERISISGGRFRGRGRFLLAFKEQLYEESAFSDLSELEVD